MKKKEMKSKEKKNDVQILNGIRKCKSFTLTPNDLFSKILMSKHQSPAEWVRLSLLFIFVFIYATAKMQHTHRVQKKRNSYSWISRRSE